MHPLIERDIALTRRQFFRSVGLNFGGVALAHLMSRDAQAAAAPAAVRVHPALPGFPHFKPRAKALIYLHMNGGPSQLDTWDYKPQLRKYFNTDLPPSVQGGQRITTMTSGQSRFPVAPSKFEFTRHGRCGMWVSSLLPHTAKVVDEISLIKTVHTNAINHDPACTFLFT